MSRCWGCCQENCLGRNCNCTCHQEDDPIHQLIQHGEKLSNYMDDKKKTILSNLEKTRAEIKSVIFSFRSTLLDNKVNVEVATILNTVVTQLEDAYARILLDINKNS